MPERLYQLGFDVGAGEELKIVTPTDVTPEGFRGFGQKESGRFIREVRGIWRIDSPATAYKYLMEHIYYPIEQFRQEEMHALMLDSLNNIRFDALIYRGNDNQILVKVKEVFYPAVLTQACAVLIAHNHPAGSLEPSPDDIRLTRDIVAAGKILDIPLLDHLLVSGRGFTSLKDRGLGFE